MKKKLQNLLYWNIENNVGHSDDLVCWFADVIVKILRNYGTNSNILIIFPDGTCPWKFFGIGFIKSQYFSL